MIVNIGRTSSACHMSLPQCALRAADRRGGGRDKNDNGLEISGMKYEARLIVGRLDFLFP